MILRDVGAGAAAGGCRVRPNHPLFAGLSERAWIEAPHPIGPRAVAVWKMRHHGALFTFSLFPHLIASRLPSLYLCGTLASAP